MNRLIVLTLSLGCVWTPVIAQDQQALIDQGEAIYARWCGHCHAPTGRATAILEQRYEGARPAVVADRTDLTEEFIGAFIRTWMPGMSAFRPTEISDEEIPALAAYLNRPR